MTDDQQNDMPPIDTDFLDDTQKSLLWIVANEIKENPEYMYVIRPNRFGNSTADTFVMHLREGRSDVPWFVKIDEIDKIKQEKDGIELWTDFLSAARGIKTPKSIVDGRSIVAYPYIPDSPTGNFATKELKDILYEEKEFEVLKKIFENLYNGLCGRAHNSSEFKSLKLIDEYQWYLRDNRSWDRIKATFSGKHEEEKFNFLGTEILNPQWLLNNGFKKDTFCNIGTVHGDLHASNVIIDSTDTPNLIDFAWGHRDAHVLKDFVLMESSVRFMLFPSHLNMDEQLKIDNILLQEDGYLDAPKLVENSQLKFHYERMAEIVGIIRTQARALWEGNTQNFDFSEYLAAQFLVLYGLLNYDTYNFHVGGRALGLIARELKDTDFGYN
ncbi:MAG: hypothetical protein HN731_06545 [Rhodospirillaceae bacterium]|jgi:hypothetical protein|nr:hypothetical protein [Rhodospirillaceae bacterium]